MDRFTYKSNHKQRLVVVLNKKEFLSVFQMQHVTFVSS